MDAPFNDVPVFVERGAVDGEHWLAGGDGEEFGVAAGGPFGADGLGGGCDGDAGIADEFVEAAFFEVCKAGARSARIQLYSTATGTPSR